MKLDEKDCEGSFKIAIDGPSGAGKSTIAKLIAKKLEIDYIDTGAMYRAIGMKMIEEGVPFEEGRTLDDLLGRTDIDFSAGKIYLDGEDVSGKIRREEISTAASRCSSLAAVREKLVALQRKIAENKSVIMDGRDIGTNVLIDAEFKFYLTAEAEERARRRYNELTAKGESHDFNHILEDIRQRDYRDTTRELNPLQRAVDAVEIDSTHMTIDQVVDFVCDKVACRLR